MKHALFLGGSKGLGLEMAKLALAADYKVTIMARTALNSELVQAGRAIGFNIFLDKMGVSLEPLHTFAISHEPFDLIVWTAGLYQEGNILDQIDPEMPYDDSKVQEMFRMHLEGPSITLIELLRRNREKQVSCHLVVAASSTSYKVREGEGLYGACKAGKAQLTRTLGLELPRLVPGSKVMLAHPGGMDTPFWEGRGRDTSKFMDPAAVAAALWNEVKAQDKPFDELHIDRQPDRSPKIARDVRPPQF